jgi:Leucine-rich repeat
MSPHAAATGRAATAAHASHSSSSSTKHAAAPVSSETNKLILDYSFMDVKTLDDLKEITLPADSRAGPAAITSIKLNNNKLESIAGLDEALATQISSSTQIKWLDLSCNAIDEIGTVLAGFDNLLSLNLHGNNLTKLADIKQLVGLTKLRSLTLHGNPVSENKHYRNFVLHFLPHLVKFDFGAITKADREAAKTWACTFRKHLSPKEDD